LLHADPGYKERIKAAARNAPSLRRGWTARGTSSRAACSTTFGTSTDTIVMEPFDIPPGWKIYRAYDHGSSKPFSVGWYAVSDGTDMKLRDGKRARDRARRSVPVKEWYGWRGQPNEGCAQLDRGHRERDHRARDQMGPARSQRPWTRVSRAARPTARSSTTTSTAPTVTIANDFEKPVMVNGVKHRGIFWEKADKGPGSREQGWEQMRKRLKATKRPEGGYREIPGLFISKECVQWLRTVPCCRATKKDRRC
jgi:hypothetical protein